MRHQILLAPRNNRFDIVHVESNTHIGYADVRGAKYCVQDFECDEVAVVHSINEAIPALREPYQKHPQQ